MKQIFIIVITLFTSFTSQSQNDTLLDVPNNWRYERMDFPLDFAPDVDFTGYEEIRFAPGMFDTLSSNYFSYVFVLNIHNRDSLSQLELTEFLEIYYKGLCQAVASEKFEVDTSQMNVELEMDTLKSAYAGNLNFFDVFTNGKEITLNVEVEKIIHQDTIGSHWLVMVSPADKNKIIWTDLYAIRFLLKENFNK